MVEIYSDFLNERLRSTRGVDVFFRKYKLRKLNLDEISLNYSLTKVNEAKKMQLILQLTRGTRGSKTISTLEYSLNTNDKAVYKSMPRTTAIQEIAR